MRSLDKEVSTIYKRHSLKESYTQIRQCWPTSKDLHIYAWCGHWKQSRNPAKSDGCLGQMPRERMKELYVISLNYIFVFDRNTRKLSILRSLLFKHHSLHFTVVWLGRRVGQKTPKFYTCFKVKSKVGDFSRGWPEGSLFNSYDTEM